MHECKGTEKIGRRPEQGAKYKNTQHVGGGESSHKETGQFDLIILYKNNSCWMRVHN